MLNIIQTKFKDIKISVFLYLIKLISLYQVSQKFKDLLHYAHNDLNNEYIYSGGYADKGAWLITSSIVFSILTFYQKKQIQTHPEFFHNTIRKRILELFLFLCCYDFLSSVNDLFYYYLDASIDSIKIINVSISLICTLACIVYVVIEYRCYNLIKSTRYYTTLLTLTVTVVLYSIFIVKQFRNSDNIKLIQSEFETISAIDICSKKIVRNYNIYHKLPESFYQLTELNLLESKANISYKLTSKKSFEMCTIVQFDNKTMKKIFNEKSFHSAEFMNIHKGKNCWQFTVKKSDYDDFDLDTKHLENVFDDTLKM